MKQCVWTWAVMAALAAVASTAAAAAPRYELLDLTARSQSIQSDAQAINNADEVVGYAVRSDGSSPPVRFVDGRAQRLVQQADHRHRGGNAEAISDAGHVAGQLVVYGTDRPVFVTLGGVTTVYSPPEGDASVTGINSQGQMTGWRARAGQPHRAFVMQDGQWVDLPVPQSDQASYGRAINDAGQVVGLVRQTVDGEVRQQGALWQDGVLKETFGLPGSPSTLALAVNRQGWVTGYSQVGRNYNQAHAFIHRDGVTSDLETRHGARSNAYGINAAGEVVGYRALAGNSGPFLYSGGRMWWLAKLLPPAQQAQWRLVTVHGINDAGHVVGFAVNAQGSLRAVMLRRLDANASAR
jgi:probable HAF family extracellular repeat protein